jgi:hypothetical protein
VDTITAGLFASAIDDWSVFNGRFHMDKLFPNESVCREYLIRKRWPHGYHCPRCYRIGYYEIEKRLLLECSNPKCRYQVSITAGTMFHRTKVPLRKWFLAIQRVNQDRFYSPTVLGELLEVSYKTAWLMLKKIRVALTYFVRETASDLRHPLEVIFTHPDDEAAPEFPKEAVLEMECAESPEEEEGVLPSYEPAKEAFLKAGLRFGKKITRFEWETRHWLKGILFRTRQSCFLLNFIACIEAPPFYCIVSGNDGAHRWIRRS